MKTIFPTKKRGVFSLLGLFLFSLDFFSKWWAHTELSNFGFYSDYYPYGGIGVFQNFLGIDFCLNYVTNKGVAWGLFASYPLLLLTIRSLLVVLIGLYACFFSKGTLRQISLLLIITGAVGNIFDYFYYGFVIDLFHFSLWGYSFPVFNVADSLIFLGITAMITLSFTKKTTQILHYEDSDQPSSG